MKNQRLPNQIIGNIGMYYVCYQLSLRGYNVMPTARNAKGIDIVAYSEDGSKYIGLQVKTLSRPSPIPLGKSNIGAANSIWCVVVLQKTGCPKVFVMTQKEISLKAHPDSKGLSWWVQYKAFGGTDEFLEKWDRIKEKLA